MFCFLFFLMFVLPICSLCLVPSPGPGEHHSHGHFRVFSFTHQCQSKSRIRFVRRRENRRTSCISTEQIDVQHTPKRAKTFSQRLLDKDFQNIDHDSKEIFKMSLHYLTLMSTLMLISQGFWKKKVIRHCSWLSQYIFIST